ncbi:pilin [Candidatus Saccharibacteria bacterium]|nr:pilin [Candidatus Saccharibacteria bacterium]
MKKALLSALIIAAGVFSLSPMLASTTLAASSTPPAETSNYVYDCNANSFLTFRAWYAGKLCDKKGNVGIDRKYGSDGLTKFIWTVVLNVVDNIFQLIGYVSVGFLMYGGYLWIFSQGVPESVAKGKKTITNAIVGLVIALFATLIVNVILGVFM